MAKASSIAVLGIIIIYLPSAGEPQTAPAPNGNYVEVANDATLKHTQSVLVDQSYRIGLGDVLRVSVWEEPQLTTSAVVRPDGKISLPLVSDVSLAGLSPEEAQAFLTTAFTKFLKHPRVAVIVEEIHSRLVYITGEVQHPGGYALTGKMNVLQLIARAGGPTEFAKKKQIYVLQQEHNKKLPVNYQMVLAGKHLEENIELSPGDTVVVP